MGVVSRRLAAVAATVVVAAVGGVEANASNGAKPPGLQFLGQAIVPTGATFGGTTIGGLSSITYDAGRGVFYSLSDDQSQFNPARFYTLHLDVSDGRLASGDVHFDEARLGRIATEALAALSDEELAERAGAPVAYAPALRGAHDLAEARALLGLSLGADREAIVAAHRRLIARNHPDSGGTQALAARLNAARDLLLRAEPQ